MGIIWGIKLAQTGTRLHIMLELFVLLSLVLFEFIQSNCDSEIYCRGPILEKIQMSGLFADSKQFVDMPTSKSKAVVISDLQTVLFYCIGTEKLCAIV